jgi:hypothetical protein
LSSKRCLLERHFEVSCLQPVKFTFPIKSVRIGYFALCISGSEHASTLTDLKHIINGDRWRIAGRMRIRHVGVAVEISLNRTGGVSWTKFECFSTRILCEDGCLSGDSNLKDIARLWDCFGSPPTIPHMGRGADVHSALCSQALCRDYGLRPHPRLRSVLWLARRDSLNEAALAKNLPHRSRENEFTDGRVKNVNSAAL